MSLEDTESILWEEAQQYGLQEYSNRSNELEQDKPKEDTIDSNSYSEFSTKDNESSENNQDYEQTQIIKSESIPVKMNEALKSHKLNCTTKAIQNKVNKEYTNNTQGLAYNSLEKNSILPNSDILSLSAAEAKYIGLIGKERLLGALNPFEDFLFKTLVTK